MCNTGIECKIQNNNEININKNNNTDFINNYKDKNIIIDNKKECNYNYTYNNKMSIWAFSMEYPKDFPIYY